MTYDDLLRKVGGKPFERRMFLLFFFNGLPNSFLAATLALIMYLPKNYHCALPDKALEYSNTEVILDYFIPLKGENGTRSKCLLYNRTTEEISAFMDNFESGNNSLKVLGSNENVTTIPCSDGHDFSNQFGINSAAAEFDLSCENIGIKPMIFTIYYVGVCVGTSSGFLSDKFGRRPVFIIFTFALFATFILQSFAHAAWSYAVTLFFGGVTNLVNYVCGFVLGTEITVPEKRNYLSISSFISFALGYGIATGIFCLTLDWRWSLRIYGLLGIFYVVVIWLTPESPRWLMANGRVEEAKKILKMIAKYNNKSERDIEDMLGDVQKEAEKLMEEERGQTANDTRTSKQAVIKEMITSPKVLMILFADTFSWFCVALVYNGISLNVQALSGNIFVNNTLLGLMEIPGYFAAYLGVKYISRPINHGALMIGSGLCCMGTALLNAATPQASTVVGLIGRALNAGAFYLVYIHTAEVFPTLLRNSSMSVGSLAGRLGSVVSPYIIYMVELYGMYSPYIMMSLLTVASGLLTLFVLPDTNNKELPETVEDMLKLKSLYRNCCRRRTDESIYVEVTCKKEGVAEVST